MTLHSSEQAAKDFVLRIGTKRATRLLDLVCGRIDRRIKIANLHTFGQFFDTGCIRTADWERELIFTIKMGLQLTKKNITHEDVVKSVKARRAAQKAAAQARRALVA